MRRRPGERGRAGGGHRSLHCLPFLSLPRRWAISVHFSGVPLPLCSATSWIRRWSFSDVKVLSWRRIGGRAGLARTALDVTVRRLFPIEAILEDAALPRPIEDDELSASE